MNIETLVAKHRASLAKHYPVLLVFVREWTRGTCLAGQTMEDSLPFCTHADAASWVESINNQHAKSFAKKDRKMTYKVIQHVIVTTEAAS